MRNLTTASLELATWIARLGSFTAAAERLNTTQPAVSARVKELEDIVGQKLFLRQGRGVELTVEGREFVRSAEQLLRQVEQLSMSFSKQTASGVVLVGTSSICLTLLAEATMKMAQTMPKVSFDVQIGRAGFLLDRLEARKIDLAILSGPIEAHKFTRRSLGLDRMLWVTTPPVLRQRHGEPAARRYAGLPVWCVHRDSFYWSDATRMLLDFGAELDRVSAIDNTMGAARIVACGAGIGLLSEKLIEAELADGTLVPLPDLPPCDEVEFSVVAMKDTESRILLEVMDALVASSRFRRTPPEA